MSLIARMERVITNRLATAYYKGISHSYLAWCCFLGCLEADDRNNIGSVLGTAPLLSQPRPLCEHTPLPERIRTPDALVKKPVDDQCQNAKTKHAPEKCT